MSNKYSRKECNWNKMKVMEKKEHKTKSTEKSTVSRRNSGKFEVKTNAKFQVKLPSEYANLTPGGICKPGS